MPLAPWVIPAAATAIGAIGAERTNRVNQAEAAKNRAFQGQQALQQMRFQERMRNTSWQSAVADMEAAGLNPAIAYSQGGAVSPGGASGGGSLAASAVDPTSSARDAAMFSKQMESMSAQIRKQKAEAKSAAAKATIDEQTTDLLTNRPTSGKVDGDGELALEMGPSFLMRQIRAGIEGAEQGVSSARALEQFTNAKTRIADPLASLADTMGPLLPILGGVGSLAGPAVNLLNRRRPFRRKKR